MLGICEGFIKRDLLKCQHIKKLSCYIFCRHNTESSTDLKVPRKDQIKLFVDKINRGKVIDQLCGFFCNSVGIIKIIVLSSIPYIYPENISKNE
jgi:hypothetical protein